MAMKMLVKVAIAVAVMGAAQTASAAGLTLEANGARAQSEWGGELGIGYSFGTLGFNIRPMVGAFVYDGGNEDLEVKPYGRVEATYSIPLLAEIGAGARFSSDKVRPYGTLAVPLLPTFKLKANVGPKYYALGVKFGF